MLLQSAKCNQKNYVQHVNFDKVHKTTVSIFALHYRLNFAHIYVCVCVKGQNCYVGFAQAPRFLGFISMFGFGQTPMSSIDLFLWTKSNGFQKFNGTPNHKHKEKKQIGSNMI